MGSRWQSRKRTTEQEVCAVNEGRSQWLGLGDSETAGNRRAIQKLTLAGWKERRREGCAGWDIWILEVTH